MEIKELAKTFKNVFDQSYVMGVDLISEISTDVSDFKSQQHLQKKKEFYRILDKIDKLASEYKLEEFVQQVRKHGNKATVNELVDKILEIEDPTKTFELPEDLHVDIRGEVQADADEVNKCFNAKCYRSSVILCGRILETALHRKYFDVSGTDLLEKSPGIGLGNLIGKISDKGVSLDPGLGNQIHLINQVRIHSVHKKQETFMPSADQTKAIILYTFDIVGRLFKDD